MIYVCPDLSEPIRQGDIFVGLPRIDMSLNEVIIINESGQSVIKWKDIEEPDKPITIIVPARPVAAIVATQDCDAIHGRDITLCEIRSFKDVEGISKDTTSPKSWKNIITQHARINQKWFYLPPDDKLGFTDKMAVDFPVTLRFSRKELEELRHLRKGRLNNIADEHFRERIGEFFRRYPYDEWYPLNPEELKIYMENYKDIKPFPWQNTGTKEINKEKTKK